jgi:peptidoglycan/LPS O-acetylase OafA/YrhL
VQHQRIPTLDGWRAVAILAVLFAHLRWPPAWQEKLPDLGYWGVQLFFALSGFLITSRLLEEYDQTGRIRWVDFYVRRAFRILPPAFFTLAVLAVLGLGFHLIRMTKTQLLASVFFYRNYSVEPGWYTAHFWSLAVEEQFYLLWPAVLSVVGVTRGARAAVALACAAAVWRPLDMHYHWIAHFQPLLEGSPYRTDYCIGQLFWGCSLAFCWRSAPIRRSLERWVRSYWVVGVIALQILVLSSKPAGYLAVMEVLMALLPLITALDPHGPFSRALETRPLVWIGNRSYSLYLWQQLFLQSPIPQRVLGTVPGLIGNFVLPFFPASFSYRFIEKPFIRMGRNFEQRLRRRGTIFQPVESALP